MVNIKFNPVWLVSSKNAYLNLKLMLFQAMATQDTAMDTTRPSHTAEVQV